MRSKYILMAFAASDSDIHSILFEITQGNVKGFESRPIKFVIFESDLSKQELIDVIIPKRINFMLVEEKDMVFNLDGFLSDTLGLKQETTLKKLSLEEQLEEAIKNEDYMIASKLRDTINKKAKKIVEKKDKKPTNNISELFD